MSKAPRFYGNDVKDNTDSRSQQQLHQLLAPMSSVSHVQEQPKEQHGVSGVDPIAFKIGGVELVNVHSTRSAATENIRCLTVHRRLGAIENMYFQFSNQGAETICLMFKLETTYNITPDIAEIAFVRLSQRHPLLRSSIATELDLLNEEQHSLVQTTPAFYDFLVVKSGQWLDVLLDEAAVKFDDKRLPLFRCRLLVSKEGQDNALKSSKPTATVNNPYISTFMFIAHHSIMDGGYIMWIFQEYVSFIDALGTGRRIPELPELPLIPQVENVLSFPSAIKSAILPKSSSSQPAFSLEVREDVSSSQVLLDYNSKFAADIQTDYSEPRNGCLTFKMSELETRAFSQACRSHGCKPKGALVTANIMALLELIYGHFGDVEVPFEYMVDFRRFCDFPALGTEVPCYPGVAVLHVPILATFRRQTGPVSEKDFWDISKIVDDFLVTSIGSRKTFEWLQSTIKLYSQNPIPPIEKGKTPYVLSISNMGQCDAALNEDLRQRVHLADLHGHSTVLVDDMPLFFVSTFVTNNQLCGNSSYCQEYTSKDTCEELLSLFRKYLSVHSKL